MEKLIGMFCVVFALTGCFQPDVDALEAKYLECGVAIEACDQQTPPECESSLGPVDTPEREACIYAVDCSSPTAIVELADCLRD